MASPSARRRPASVVAEPAGRSFQGSTQKGARLLQTLCIVVLPCTVQTLSLPQDSKSSRVTLKQCANAAKGIGAFAAGRKAAVVFKQGQFVGSYEGEVLTEAQIQQRYSGGRLGSFIMAIGDGYFIDAQDTEKSNWTRFINHSARRPNLQIHTDPDERRVAFLAGRNILADEELLFNYGPQYWRPAHQQMLDDVRSCEAAFHLVLYYGAEYTPVVAEE